MFCLPKTAWPPTSPQAGNGENAHRELRGNAKTPERAVAGKRRRPAKRVPARRSGHRTGGSGDEQSSGLRVIASQPRKRLSRAGVLSVRTPLAALSSRKPQGRKALRRPVQAACPRATAQAVVRASANGAR